MQYSFDNGYGASVIDYGYGSETRPFELAVLHGKSLCYKTPITNDVIGFQNDDDIKELLAQIKALPANELCDHRRNWDDDDD